MLFPPFALNLNKDFHQIFPPHLGQHVGNVSGSGDRCKTQRQRKKSPSIKVNVCVYPLIYFKTLKRLTVHHKVNYVSTADVDSPVLIAGTEDLNQISSLRFFSVLEVKTKQTGRSSCYFEIIK